MDSDEEEKAPTPFLPIDAYEDKEPFFDKQYSSGQIEIYYAKI